MYYVGDFTITKREILFVIILVCLSLCLGFWINNIIDDHYTQKEEVYNKALKINNENDKFKYALDTSVGNIINYGKFEVVDGIKDGWLISDYLAYTKVTERYTRHSRESCSTDSNGNRHCHTEYYYTWDETDEKTIYADKIIYSGVEFYVSKFNNYPWQRLSLSNSTIKSNVGYIKHGYIYEENNFWNSVGDLRFYYKVVPKEFYGTTFGVAKNKNYTPYNDNKISIENCSLDEYISSQKSYKTMTKVFFWIFYIVLVGFGIYGFIYLDNKWLEDNYGRS